MNLAKRNLKLEECRRAFEGGDSASAERICQGLLRTHRADTRALHILAVIASARADDAAAVVYLGRCVAIEPRNASFHNDLARVHALAGRYALALASLHRALALAPGNGRAITDLADILERSGQAEAGWEALAPLVSAGPIGEDMALVAMRLLDRAGKTEQAIAMGRRFAAAPSGDDATRRFLLQLMGRLCDKAGDRAAAFQAFAEAKQTERHRFVPADFGRDIDALISVFSEEALARLPRASQRSQTPVFIACMPRSGSTLVEQVIHAHPRAWGAGETELLHSAVVNLPTQLGAALP